MTRAELAARPEAAQEFRPEAVVDTFALTCADAEADLRGIPGELPRVVVSSGDVYRAYRSVQAGTITDTVPLGETAPLRVERYPYAGQPPEATPGVDPDQYEKLDVEAYRAAGATVLRLGFVYGEHDYQRREEFILRRPRAGRARIPIGPGSWIVSRTYVRDAARAARLVLERGVRATFNVCEASGTPVRLWASRSSRRRVSEPTGSSRCRPSAYRPTSGPPASRPAPLSRLPPSPRDPRLAGDRDRAGGQGLRALAPHAPPPAETDGFELDDQALADQDASL